MREAGRFGRLAAAMSVVIVVAALILTGCGKNDSNVTGGQEEPPEVSTPDVVVVDISEESAEWNYMVIAEDGSSMFINVDESTDIPSRVFLKPDKDSDSGATVFFKENGLPDKLVIDGHILYYGNFTGFKYDAAVIYPDSRIEYLLGVETNVNWDEYIAASGLYKGRSANGFWGNWVFPAMLTAATCALSVPVPALGFGCATGIFSYASHLVVEAVDAFCKTCDVSGYRFLLNGFDCANFFSGDWNSMLSVLGARGAMNACVAAVTTMTDAIASQGADITNEKNTEINEAIETIDGGGVTVSAYTVTFSVNGGDGPAPAKQNVYPGLSIALPSGSDMTKYGYLFGGWNTDWEGSGTNYSAGSSFTPTASMTLYAKWRPVYTVRFNAGGGKGTIPGAQTAAEGSSIILPDHGDLILSVGYIFDGWNECSPTQFNNYCSDKGTNYSAYSSFKPTSNTTLYAQWKWVRGSQFNPNINYTPFTDSRDGKSYMKITIGSQTWMAENLNYNAENSLCYDNRADSCEKYGRLYPWADALSACPAGWHLPSDAEWTTLTDYVKDVTDDIVGSILTNAGRYLKSQIVWNDCGPSGSGSPNVCADTYGFSALPGGAGYDVIEQSFSDAGKYGRWWSDKDTTMRDAARGTLLDVARIRELQNAGEFVGMAYLDKKYQLSVRCVQN